MAAGGAATDAAAASAASIDRQVGTGVRHRVSEAVVEVVGGAEVVATAVPAAAVAAGEVRQARASSPLCQ